MRFSLILLLAIFFSLGCAKMQIGGTKEPIKLDLSARLDIYQHVEKDIDAIESIVSGSKDNKSVVNKQSLLGIFVREVYAQEGLSSEVEQAALRRKNRLGELSSWEAKGVIGENKNGLVEIRDSQGVSSAAGQIVAGENADRIIIYQSVANKNGTSIEEVQKLYAKRLQTNAPTGTPVETPDGAWKVK